MTESDRRFDPIDPAPSPGWPATLTMAAILGLALASCWALSRPGGMPATASKGGER